MLQVKNNVTNKGEIMNSAIFLPKTIKVGFQKRSDTYTGQLAYIIYFDQKGVLRKESSWNSWRDTDIEPQEFSNEPTSGFVLNKKVGGYSSGWNHRQTYTRVYDPRGFEFEITVPNLLYILENTNSIKGKGLEGDFVYGWDGKDLILIPTSSPDYITISSFNEKVHSSTSFKGKDLILGATYKFKDNRNKIYMGRFQKENGEEKEVNEYFFNEEHRYYEDGYFTSLKSLSGQIIDVVDENCTENYANLMDKLKETGKISERDPRKDAYVPYALEEFKIRMNKVYYGESFYNQTGTKYFVSNNSYSWYNSYQSYRVYDNNRNRRDNIIDDEMTLERIYEKYKPHYLVTYKSNGEKIKEWRTK